MGSCCCCGSSSNVADESAASRLQMVGPADPASGPAALLRLEPGSTALRKHIAGMPFELLAWTEIASSGGLYFFSVLSGSTSWTRPQGMLPQTLRSSVSCLDAREMPLSAALCAERKIALVLHDPTALDSSFGSLVKGTAPLLADCLFFDRLLSRELGLYPGEFLALTGLRRIVIAGGLAFHEQRRRAIPVQESGTLYLDPAPLVCYYLQDVLHHELFHLFDHKVQAVAAAAEPQSDAGIVWHSDDRDSGDSNDFTGVGLVAVAPAAAPSPAATSTSTSSSASSVAASASASSFAGPGGDHAQPTMTAAVAKFASSSVAQVVIVKWHSEQKDAAWAALNVQGFAYGGGGAFNRNMNAFLPLAESKDTDVVPGFLNRYSMSAVEEDKAEIYAGLMRRCSALLLSSDAILQRKAQEMRRRLLLFCPLLDERFWLRTERAAPLSPAQTAGRWEQRADSHGHTYWHNASTNAMSWIPPDHLLRPDSPIALPDIPRAQAAAAAGTST